MPVSRGGVLLATIRRNSQAGQLIIFGTQKSVLWKNRLHLATLTAKLSLQYSRWVWDAKMPYLAKIIKVQELFLKSVNLWNFHYPLGPLFPYILQGRIKNPKFLRQKLVLLSCSYIYQISRNLPAKINHCWLNSHVNQTKKNIFKKFQEENEDFFFWN